MAAGRGVSSSTKTGCPVCGAKATNPNIGRDGSLRVAGIIYYQPCMEPTAVKSRQRARNLRAQNTARQAK